LFWLNQEKLEIKLRGSQLTTRLTGGSTSMGLH